MIAIIDYKAGNLTSVRLAFETIGAEARITSDPAEIRAADRILFPGVGAAASTMENIRASGLVGILRERIDAGTPFLGICMGMQVLFDRSEEDGGVPCLGFLPGAVKRFIPRAHEDKIPEMGWNQAKIVRPHPLLDGIPDGSDFYFVHSYYVDPARAEDVVCTTEHAGTVFCSMAGRGNLAATQFHPEKSGKIGLKLLENFVHWAP